MLALVFICHESTIVAEPDLFNTDPDPTCLIETAQDAGADPSDGSLKELRSTYWYITGVGGSLELSHHLRSDL
jgi:hypothetical protein